MNKLILVGIAAITAGGSGQMDNRHDPRAIAPAREGDIAIREEFCAARASQTAAAYDLFIARHPQHELADVARRERSALVAAQKPTR